MTEMTLEKLSRFVNKGVIVHPWHGIDLRPEHGDETFVHAYVEIVPSDTVKFELDKKSGFLMIDRPNKLSNTMPCMYGFVPKTYCDENVAAHTRKATGDDSIEGDGDPLDICVLTDRTFSGGNFFASVKVLGGFRMLDGGEADDKIIAVLKDDHVYGDFSDVSELPSKVLTKLKHYFLTYKEIPEAGKKPKVEITHTYGADEAKTIVTLASKDYEQKIATEIR